jgi:hypothetical protein
MDLNPNTKTKLSQKPVELKLNEEISFADLIKKLGFDESYSVFAYYDRYVCNEKQQKTVSVLAKAVNASKRIIITDLTKENLSDFIQKNAPEIELTNLKTIIKGRLPHDRYLITVHKGEINVWNVSNSIDYIRFSEQNINKNTTGIINQSVVFTPVSKEMLNTDLLNFIKNKSNGN